MMQKLSPKIIPSVLAFLKKEGVVICPTDTVYGFLADGTNKKAVDKIYKIKKRPRSKPLSVFVKDITMAKQVAFVNKQQTVRLKKYWPGKYTFILKKKPDNKLFGLDKNTIALRIPKHAFLQLLLKKINRPLVQTSVNISGNTHLGNISDIVNQFDKKHILIIDGGDIKKSKPSTIIDLTGSRLTKLRK